MRKIVSMYYCQYPCHPTSSLRYQVPRRTYFVDHTEPLRSEAATSRTKNWPYFWTQTKHMTLTQNQLVLLKSFLNKPFSTSRSHFHEIQGALCKNHIPRNDAVDRALQYARFQTLFYAAPHLARTLKFSRSRTFLPSALDFLCNKWHIISQWIGFRYSSGENRLEFRRSTRFRRSLKAALTARTKSSEGTKRWSSYYGFSKFSKRPDRTTPNSDCTSMTSAVRAPYKL